MDQNKLYKGVRHSMVSNTKILALISLISSIAHTTLLSYRDYILQVLRERGGEEKKVKEIVRFINFLSIISAYPMINREIRITQIMKNSRRK